MTGTFSRSVSVCSGRVDVDEHAVRAAVVVRVEGRLDPERLTNPLSGVLKGRHDLRLAVDEYWRGRHGRRRLSQHARAKTGAHGQGERNAKGRHDELAAGSSSWPHLSAAARDCQAARVTGFARPITTDCAPTFARHRADRDVCI